MTDIVEDEAEDQDESKSPMKLLKPRGSISKKGANNVSPQKRRRTQVYDVS